jgi:multiple sugar transport system substrate-binding protein
MRTRISKTACFASLVVALLAGTSAARADFWSEAAKPYSGAVIRGVSESTPPSNYVKDVLAKDFEKATGIKVEFETTSWDQMYDKAIKDMEAKTGIYDFVYIEQDIIYSYLSRKFLVDISKSLADDPKLAAPEFKVDAFTTFINYFKDSSGDIYGVPMEAFIKTYLYRKDLFEDPKAKEAFKAKYGYDLAVPKTWKEMRDIAEFFHRPDQNRYGIAIYTDNSYDALVMGVENVVFSYGGELGDYATYKVDGIINSPENVKALELYRELHNFTPPGWAKAFFVEDNQAITENLAAMSMNYFAFFPALVNEASNPNAKVTGFFANPTGPTGKQFAALGGQGISIVSYSKNQEEAFKFLEWFIKDSTQKKWAELGGYTCNKAVLESTEFQNATPYNRAFYETMFKVKDFWATPEYAELLIQMNQRIYPYITAGQGTAKESLDALAGDWNATFKKYKRTQ